MFMLKDISTRYVFDGGVDRCVMGTINHKDVREAKLLYYLTVESGIQSILDEAAEYACRLLEYVTDPRLQSILAELATTPTRDTLAELIMSCDALYATPQGREFVGLLRVVDEPAIAAMAARRFLLEYLDNKISLKLFFVQISMIEGISQLEYVKDLGFSLSSAPYFQFRVRPDGSTCLQRFMDADEICAELVKIGPGLLLELECIIKAKDE